MKAGRVLTGIGLGAAALTLTIGTGPAAAGTRGVEHFQLLGSNPADGADRVIVATGPIHAMGTDHPVSDSIDSFVFPQGTLMIRHEAKPSTQKNTFDPVTCYGTYREKGSYRVVSGTGAYQGATGRGNYRVLVKTVGCDQSQPPVYFNIEINAQGPLHLAHKG